MAFVQPANMAEVDENIEPTMKKDKGKRFERS
jgi:hypothetical protein